MTTTKQELKVRLDGELLQRVRNLHPGYGELSSVVSGILALYVEIAEQPRHRGVERELRARFEGLVNGTGSHGRL